MKEKDPAACPAKRQLELSTGHAEMDLTCDLYADHRGRCRTVVSTTVSIFWDKP